MSNEFKWYRDRDTGLVDRYPEDVAALFYDKWEEVPSENANCVDCGPKNEVNDEVFLVHGDDTPDPVVSRNKKNEAK